MFLLPKDSHPLVTRKGRAWTPPQLGIQNTVKDVRFRPEEVLVDPNGEFGKGPNADGVAGWYALHDYFVFKRGGFIFIVHERNIQRMPDES